MINYYARGGLVKEYEILHELQKLMRSMKLEFQKDMFHPEITKQELELLMTIQRFSTKHGKVSASELADFYGVTIPAIMHKLARLENNNFIERRGDEIDKRIKYIFLTDETEQECMKIQQRRNELIKEYFTFLGVEDQKVLEHLILRSIQFLEAKK